MKHLAVQTKGFTLIETIVFLVVVSVALAAVVTVFSNSMYFERSDGSIRSNSVDPVVRTRALELAQAQMDQILARRFDENTPSGGVPACDSTAGVACAGIVVDTDFDDVGDYNLFASGDLDYPLNVTVANAGTELGLASNERARRITITVGMPTGDTVTISSYKANF